MPAPQPASLARRLAAVAYEGLLLSALLLIAGFVLAPAVSPGPTAVVQGTLPVPSLAARILLFAAMFGLGALYFGWSWTGGRRTLPMKTWRMRLVMRDGRAAVTPGTALIRYCAAWIGPGARAARLCRLGPDGSRPRRAVARRVQLCLGVGRPGPGIPARPDRGHAHCRRSRSITRSTHGEPAIAAMATPDSEFACARRPPTPRRAGETSPRRPRSAPCRRSRPHRASRRTSARP